MAASCNRVLEANGEQQERTSGLAAAKRTGRLSQHGSLLRAPFRILGDGAGLVLDGKGECGGRKVAGLFVGT